MKKLFFYCALVILICPLNVFAQAPVVTSFSPLRQVLNAPRNTQINVDFNTALNPQTVNDSTFRVFGRQLGPIPGLLQLQNGNTRIVFTPSSQFLAGEWVTVALSKGIKSQNNVPMNTGFNWNFWTKADKGTLNQTLISTIQVRRPAEGLIQCYGALGMDLNDDGKTDLAIVNEISRDFRIFLNNGTNFDTIFAIHTVPSGSFPSPSEAADFNHDGKVDIVIGNAGNNILSLFIASGGANFLPGVSYNAGSLVRGLGIIDLDGDGYDDIVTANRGGNNISLFRNNGNGTFNSPVNINTVGTSETAIMITDANNDGIQDAFIGCFGSNEIVLMLGDGNGSFTFSSRSGLTGSPWAIAVGDINGDGNADVAAALSNIDRIGVIFGNGSGGLGSVTTYTSGDFPLAIDIGDVDGDNDLDLISSNYGSGEFKVYENFGNGTFSNNPITLPASKAGSCITVHDRDNDGDLDLAGIDEVDDLLFIFDNNTSIGIPITSTEIPKDYKLHQNFPNPFNPVTKISFEIPELKFAELKVYNALGALVETLVSEELKPGIYEVIFDRSNLPSGVYFYILNAGKFFQARKMIVLK
ncbi:MAG: FG-GAP-like repeat-containing protein [Chlorobi bacterium]|nr:FG-GAP-like repeat-containing protein [Chlorobiota bacterium]